MSGRSCILSAECPAVTNFTLFAFSDVGIACMKTCLKIMLLHFEESSTVSDWFPIDLFLLKKTCILPKKWKALVGPCPPEQRKRDVSLKPKSLL